MGLEARRPGWDRLLLAGACIVLGQVGAARAQSCVRQGEAATQCRLMLSQPRTFAIEAGVSLADQHGRGPARLTIKVDGRSCLDAELIPLARLSGRCTTALAAGDHTIKAAIATPVGRPLGVGVTLAPGARLAALPRERDELFSKPRWSHP